MFDHEARRSVGYRRERCVSRRFWEHHSSNHDFGAFGIVVAVNHAKLQSSRGVEARSELHAGRGTAQFKAVLRSNCFTW